MKNIIATNTFLMLTVLIFKMSDSGPMQQKGGLANPVTYGVLSDDLG